MTKEFMKNIKTCGITADNELGAMFFEHQDGTVITLSFKQILENQEKVPRYNDRLGKIQAYCRILQDGDPYNEDPKEILDFVEKTLGNEYYGDKK